MKDFTAIKILNKMKFVSKLMGADHEDLVKILQLKLTLDGRRENTFTKGSNFEEKKETSGAFKSYWGYGLFGLLLVPVTFVGEKPFFSLSLFFGVVLFLLVSTMISDFSSVLLDTKDKSILLTKPIDRKTLTAARMIHIFIYIFTVMSLLTLPAMISYTVRYGAIFLLMLVVTIILLCLISILFTSFLYTIMLKIFDGEKLKDVINIFQIVLTIGLSVGYQLVARVFNIVGTDLVFNVKWWSFFMVPVWFAAPFKVVFEGDKSISIIVLTVIAVLAPIVAFVVNAKWISPNFEGYLNKLDQSEKGKAKRRSIKTMWEDFFINIAGRNAQEKALIRFSHNIITKERESKLRIYPSIAMAVVFPFLMMLVNMSDYDSFSAFLAEAINLKSILFFYLTSFLASSLVYMISFSANYNAGWIFKTLPVSDESLVRRAATKAYLMCYYFPVMLIVLLLFTLKFGLVAFVHSLFLLVSGLLTTVVVVRISQIEMPFTTKFSVQGQKDNSVTRMFAMGIVTGVTFGVHKVLFSNTLAIIIACASVIAITVFLWHVTFSPTKVVANQKVTKTKTDLEKAV